MNRRHHRERHALVTLWRPVDGPLFSDEARASRAEALRKWRGQDDEKADKADEEINMGINTK